VSLPIYVHRNVVNGKEYLAFQKNRGTPHAGKRVPIHAAPGSAEFWTLYNELLSEKPGAVDPKSVSAMIKEFRKSPEWTRLKPATHRNYNIYLNVFDERLGERQADEITPKVILTLRDTFADRPVTANHIVTVIKTLYQFGIPREYATVNPAREIKSISVTSDGMQPWPSWALDMAMTKTRWEVATFVALGLYTGQRTADILAMKLSDIEDNLISVKQSKTGKRLQIRIHSKLRPFITQCRKRGIEHLVSGRGGKPLDTNRWRAIWGRELEKKHLKRLADSGVAPHGLRKSAVVTLRELDVSIERIQAITGQSRQMVELYAKGVDQRKMADRGIRQWEKKGRKTVQTDPKRPPKGDDLYK
jgi:integrase